MRRPWLAWLSSSSTRWGMRRRRGICLAASNSIDERNDSGCGIAERSETTSRAESISENDGSTWRSDPSRVTKARPRVVSQRGARMPKVDSIENSSSNTALSTEAPLPTWWARNWSMAASRSAPRPSPSTIPASSSASRTTVESPVMAPARSSMNTCR